MINKCSTTCYRLLMTTMLLTMSDRDHMSRIKTEIIEKLKVENNVVQHQKFPLQILEMSYRTFKQKQRTAATITVSLCETEKRPL